MTFSSMMDYPDGVRQVLSLLEQYNTTYQLRSFKALAHHASEAAVLLGCPLGAVVKSLVFQITANGSMFLVLVSGENRVDLDLLSKLVGGAVRPAASESVQEIVGYPVGAVPPFGLKKQFPVFIDEDLMAHDIVWGSAGSVNILLGIAPEDLKKLSLGYVAKLKNTQDDGTR